MCIVLVKWSDRRQLSLLPTAGWEMSTGQSMVMLRSWGVKARWLIPFVGAHVGGK